MVFFLIDRFDLETKCQIKDIVVLSHTKLPIHFLIKPLKSKVHAHDVPKCNHSAMSNIPIEIRKNLCLFCTVYRLVVDINLLSQGFSNLCSPLVSLECGAILT